MYRKAAAVEQVTVQNRKDSLFHSIPAILICSLHFPVNPVIAFGKSTKYEKENHIFKQSIWAQSLQRWKFPSVSGQRCCSV